MDPQIWTDVDVDVQTALATAIPASGISKANPAVVSATAHGLSDGAVVLVRCRGINGLDWTVAEVDDSDTDSFKLKGIDTSGAKGTFVSGSVQAITFGASASTLQEVTPSGGESADVPISTIHQIPDYSIPGKPTPLVFAFGSLWVPDDPALVELAKASKVKAVRAVRFSWPDGTQGLFAGIPSVSMAPGGTSGNPVTTPVKINVRGPFTAYAGTAV